MTGILSLNHNTWTIPRHDIGISTQYLVPWVLNCFVQTILSLTQQRDKIHTWHSDDDKKA